jgi:L-asparagine oxygenase
MRSPSVTGSFADPEAQLEGHMLEAPTLPTYDLSPGESTSIMRLLEGRADEPLSGAQAHSLARRLPERLLEFLYEFQLTEPAGGLVVRGFPINDAEIGPTPTQWRDAVLRTSTIVYERYLLLLASALGEVFAFQALQDGRLIQDLLPIPGQEDEKNGNSSRSLLDLHTEDAFHPNRCDYLGLLCLRNVDSIPTSYADFAPSAVPPEVLEVLFKPRFIIEPDASHGLPDKSEPTALLWGARARPYLQVDDGFTHPLPGDTAAGEAFTALMAALAATERAITLRPGEVVIIDNHLAVHGRRPFKARYDGTDRWLKRASVTRDLRRSRALRDTPDSRLLR